jgi:hypothetical protein
MMDAEEKMIGNNQSNNDSRPLIFSLIFSDSEAAHRYAREEYGARTLIPPTRGRPTTKPLKGYWRQRMKTHFNNKKYGQRWQIETVNSMIKRSMGSALRARTYWSQSREITLRVLTHNIMIIPC